MILYRLCKAAHVALDGEGARLWGGRWNSAGRPMVYAAATPSLAVLEVLVHLDVPPELLPDDLRLLTIEVPDGASIQRLDPSPTDDDTCLEAGNLFLKTCKHLVMQVRSVVVPQEWNALINVLHPEMAGVTIIRNEPFQIDPRLLR
ncbi:RES family NAD+ phosphorylase [Sphingobium yanoikuyae]|uniref:RES family NAD+ phosphorylase n=1 Tax=Sphingobium yanoikuyae TaxID=13690 RepID=UPI0022DD4DF3|nr:RES family NAD+ phosphorylase [Sphingobium yanoikuyae]WBQ19097.1 RES family NAD+ phosphorylase [Sphingobium yanoikuyae]